MKHENKILMLFVSLHLQSVHVIKTNMSELRQIARKKCNFNTGTFLFYFVNGKYGFVQLRPQFTKGALAFSFYVL